MVKVNLKKKTEAVSFFVRCRLLSFVVIPRVIIPPTKMPLCTIEEGERLFSALTSDKNISARQRQSYTELLAVIKDITKDLDPKNREKSER